MDAETVRWLLTAAGSLITTLGAFILNSMKNDLANVKTENILLRADLESVKREYMHKNDFKEFKVELKEMFQEFKQDIKESLTHGKQ
jgi:hypothetical protein